MKIYAGVGVIYNLDAEKYNLKPNKQIKCKLITGTFYVVGVGKDKKLTSLTTYDKQRYFYITEHINLPRSVSYYGVCAMLFKLVNNIKQKSFVEMMENGKYNK